MTADRNVTYLPAAVLAAMEADEDQRVPAEFAIRARELRNRFLIGEPRRG